MGLGAPGRDGKESGRKPRGQIPELYCPIQGSGERDGEDEGETEVGGGRDGKPGGGLTAVENGLWASQLTVASVVDHTI